MGFPASPPAALSRPSRPPRRPEFLSGSTLNTSGPLKPNRPCRVPSGPLRFSGFFQIPSSVFSGPFRSFQVISGPFRSCQVISGPLRFSQVFSGVSGSVTSFQFISGVFRCPQVLSGPVRSPYARSSSLRSSQIRSNTLRSAYFIIIVQVQTNENMNKFKASLPFFLSPCMG